jgi:hypothetical protein
MIFIFLSLELGDCYLESPMLITFRTEKNELIVRGTSAEG